jgi:hypothetical protein
MPGTAMGKSVGVVVPGTAQTTKKIEEEEPS